MKPIIRRLFNELAQLITKLRIVAACIYKWVKRAWRIVSANPSRSDELSNGQRFLGMLIAIALIVFGFVVWYSPPTHSFMEIGPSGDVVKATKEQTEGATPFLVLVVGGLIILGFVLNRLRFTKITAAMLARKPKMREKRRNITTIK